MKTRSRWIEEIATLEAATFSFSVPATSGTCGEPWRPRAEAYVAAGAMR
jgi:hypothetical protein